MVPGQLSSLLWKVRSDLVNTANVLSRISPPLKYCTLYYWGSIGCSGLKTFLKQFHSRSLILGSQNRYQSLFGITLVSHRNKKGFTKSLKQPWKSLINSPFSTNVTEHEEKSINAIIDTPKSFSYLKVYDPKSKAFPFHISDSSDQP